MFIAYKHIGLLNTLPGLVICYLVLTLPLATWLLTNYFSQIPKELEEAAIVDGGTRVQALHKVIVPVAMPAMFTVAILSFILAWNDSPLRCRSSRLPNNYTAPLAIYNLGNSQYQVFYNLIDAAVVIISLPIACLVIFAQKRIISGLTEARSANQASKDSSSERHRFLKFGRRRFACGRSRTNTKP